MITSQLREMKHYSVVICGCLLVMSFSCGRSGTAEVSSESGDFVEMEADKEDRSKRPSPPRTSTADISGVNVTIDYSAPAVKGREIFGGLEPYGKIWRTGANEATVLTNDGDIEIDGQLLPAGQYALFTIPGEEEWIVIFNKEPNQWGSFNYDEKQDQLRVKVTPTTSSEITERLSFKVAPEGRIDFAWEKVAFSLAVNTPTAP